jgi:TonB family protein
MNKEVLAFVGRHDEPGVMAADRRRPKRVRHAALMAAAEPLARPVLRVLPVWVFAPVLGAALVLHMALFLLLVFYHDSAPAGPKAIAVQMVTAVPKAVDKPVQKLTGKAVAAAAAKPAAQAVQKQPVVHVVPKPMPAPPVVLKQAPAVPKAAAAVAHREVPRAAGNAAGVDKYVAASIYDPAGNPRLYCPAGGRVGAVVYLNILVVPQGKADVPVYPQVTVVQSSGDAAVDAAAQAVFSKWRYTPRIANGVPVPWETVQTAQPCG